MSSERAALIGALAYAAAAIVTFGHSAANSDDSAAMRDCLAREYSSVVLCQGDSGVRRISGATFAAMLWPLYWSWEAWS